MRVVCCRTVLQCAASAPGDFQHRPAILTAVADRACLFWLNLLEVGVSFPPGFQAFRTISASELRLGDGQVTLPAAEQVRCLVR